MDRGDGAAPWRFGMGMIRCGAQDGTQSVALVVTLDEVPLTPAIIIGAEALRRLPRRSLPLSSLRLLCPLERVVRCLTKAGKGCPKAILRDPLPIFVAHPFLQPSGCLNCSRAESANRLAISLPPDPSSRSFFALRISNRPLGFSRLLTLVSPVRPTSQSSRTPQAERLDLFSVP